LGVSVRAGKIFCVARTLTQSVEPVATGAARQPVQARLHSPDIGGRLYFLPANMQTSDKLFLQYKKSRTDIRREVVNR
jgi:hypothetical protein